MGELTVLLPSGIRVKITTSPRMLLLKVLELACAKHKLDPDCLGLKRSGGLTGSKALIDLTSPVQFSGIPNCAVLEAVEATRTTRPCRVALAPPNGGQRVTKEFPITATLWDILAHWDAVDPSLHLTTKFEEPSPGSSERDDETTESAAKQSRGAHRLFMLPACRFVREEINTLKALRTTTLKMLGLNGGKALITVRYTKTKISEDELAKALADGEPAADTDAHGAEMKRLKAARRAADDADDEDEVERLSKLIKALKTPAGDRGTPAATPAAAPAATMSAAAAPAAAMSAASPMELDATPVMTESMAAAPAPSQPATAAVEPDTATMEVSSAVQELDLTPTPTPDPPAVAAAVIVWQATVDPASRDRLKKKLLNAAVQGLAPEERVSRLDEFIGRVSKVEAKVWDGSDTADEYYERVSEKLMKIKLRNASPDEPTFAGRQPVPMQNEVAAAPIAVEYYQPPVEAPVQPKTSASKRMAEPKPKELPPPPPIVIPDRALRVLRTGESGQVEEEDVDDSFFDVTAAEVKAMLGAAKKLQAPSEAPLLTAFSRKRIQAEKDARYQVCRIRIYLPDRFVLQFMAHPLEPVSALTDAVKDALEDPSLPFYLYTTPPKTVLSDPKQSLLRANLVPKANVRIGVPRPDGSGKALALKASLKKEVATVAEVHSPKPPANPIKKSTAMDILATATGRGVSSASAAESASASASASASPAKPEGSGPKAGKGKGSQFLRLSKR